MPFPVIGIVFLPIAASAGASLWGTDVRRVLEFPDATADNTTILDHGTSVVAVTRTADPYSTSVADGVEANFGWAIDPADMTVPGSYRRTYAGDHFGVVYMSQSGPLAVTGTLTMFVYHVGVGPARVRTLVGSGSVSVTIPASPGTIGSTGLVAAGIPQLDFAEDETLQWSFEFSATGIPVIGRTVRIITGTNAPGEEAFISFPATAILTPTDCPTAVDYVAAPADASRTGFNDDLMLPAGDSGDHFLRLSPTKAWIVLASPTALTQGTPLTTTVTAGLPQLAGSEVPGTDKFIHCWPGAGLLNYRVFTRSGMTVTAAADATVAATSMTGPGFGSNRPTMFVALSATRFVAVSSNSSGAAVRWWTFTLTGSTLTFVATGTTAGKNGGWARIYRIDSTRFLLHSGGGDMRIGSVNAAGTTITFGAERSDQTSFTRLDGLEHLAGNLIRAWEAGTAPASDVLNAYEFAGTAFSLVDTHTLDDDMNAAGSTPHVVTNNGDWMLGAAADAALLTVDTLVASGSPSFDFIRADGEHIAASPVNDNANDNDGWTRRFWPYGDERAVSVATHSFTFTPGTVLIRPPCFTAPEDYGNWHVGSIPNQIP